MEQWQAEEVVDLRGIPCPQNSARALIKLATIDADVLVELLVSQGEPLENVPASLESAGHAVLHKIQRPGDHWSIFVRT